MAQGSKTPDEVVAKFRRAYLRSGNAASAARSVGIHRSTGAVLAKEANDDPAFRQARTDLLAHGLERVELMLIEASSIAMARIRRKAPEAEDIAKIIEQYDLKSLNYHDPRPAYFGALVNAHRSLKTKLADVEERPAQVVVNIQTKDEVGVDADDRSGTEPPAE